MKALVGAFNQEKALVGAFSVIVQLHRLINLRHYYLRFYLVNSIIYLIIWTLGTFKLKKRDLQQEGFNPFHMDHEQEIYIVDNSMKTYVLVTQEVYNNIVNGNMRF